MASAAKSHLLKFHERTHPHYLQKPPMNTRSLILFFCIFLSLHYFDDLLVEVFIKHGNFKVLLVLLSACTGLHFLSKFFFVSFRVCAN